MPMAAPHIKARFRRDGFTLLELIIVVTILAIVLALTVVAVQHLRLDAQQSDALDKLKALAIACHECNDNYKRMAPAFAPFGPKAFPTTVHVHLLPFLGEGTFFDAYDPDGAQSINKSLTCFSAIGDYSVTENEGGVQSFAANLRAFSDRGSDARYDKDMEDLAGEFPCSFGIGNGFPDGTSNTLLFATKFGACGTGGSRFAAAPDNRMAAFFGSATASHLAHRRNPGITFQLAPARQECRPSPLIAQSFTNRFLAAVTADGSTRRISIGLMAETWNRVLHPRDGLAFASHL